jgi:hypothetical protein
MTTMEQGAQTPRETAVIEVGSTRIEVDEKLAVAAGWLVGADGRAREDKLYHYLRLAQALSEGHRGEAAVLRSIALGEEERRAKRASEDLTKAAQLNAKAAEDNLRAALITSNAARRA